jgi:hypothetical protein
MTEPLSSHARVLLDYATQSAKQRRHASVQPLHVALAMVQRDRARAELEWGPLVDDVEAAAARMTSGGGTPAVLDATTALLAGVAKKGDEWNVVGAELPSILRGADGPGKPGPPGTDNTARAPQDAGGDGAARAGRDDLRAAPDEGDVRDRPAAGPPARPPVASPPLVATAMATFLEEMRPVVSRVGSVRSTTVAWAAKDPAEQSVLDDLWALVQQLATADGVWDDGEIALVHEFFEARCTALPDRGAPLSGNTMTAVLAALHADDTATGGRAAERYARGLVRIGQAVCSLHRELGLDEAKGLDALRMRFRSVLAAGNGSGGPPALVGDDATNEALAELASLVGLEEVKAEISAFAQLTAVNKLRQARGGAAALPTLHMAFLGNPGTGKTTVARILGRVLAGLGVLPKGHFIEVDRSDLIATYVGQTAPKVHDLIRRARGGVLFIDEAYSLTGRQRGDGGYEHEAIDTLMKLMEDLRHEVVVVVAGYPDLMLEFFDSNPGLGARIATRLYFRDYTLDELMAIFDAFCADEHRTCPPDARTAVKKLLDVMREQVHFGNGRDVRNVFEVLDRRLAARVAPLGELATDDELTTFAPSDVPAVPPPRDDAAYL